MEVETKRLVSNVVDGYPDGKVHGANMGPIWGRQDPGGPHVGLMNFAIWVIILKKVVLTALMLYNKAFRRN